MAQRACGVSVGGDLDRGLFTKANIGAEAGRVLVAGLGLEFGGGAAGGRRSVSPIHHCGEAFGRQVRDGAGAADVDELGEAVVVAGAVVTAGIWSR
ncbi:hypothetical protein ABT352_38950 [Streptosporangium sp. NPDC000563]|uniref:hypothetical protein n=1 Tax=Streptosporangium sp. NPDC000563 TaxID=3154366 RepID=UPI003321C1A4